MADDTIFDKIINKKIPATLVYEDDYVIAFNDINPQAPVHVLVIPKTKLIDFVAIAAAPSDLVSGFMQGVSKTAKALGLAEHGFRVVFNTGKDGQQSVAYLHAHILGGRQLAWPPG